MFPWLRFAGTLSRRGLSSALPRAVRRHAAPRAAARLLAAGVLRANAAPGLCLAPAPARGKGRRRRQASGILHCSNHRRWR